MNSITLKKLDCQQPNTQKLKKSISTENKRENKDLRSQRRQEKREFKKNYKVDWHLFNWAKRFCYSLKGKSAKVVKCELEIIYYVKRLYGNNLNWIRSHLYSDPTFCKEYGKVFLDNCIKNIYNKYFVIGKHKRNDLSYSKPIISPSKPSDITTDQEIVKFFKRPLTDTNPHLRKQIEKNELRYMTPSYINLDLNTIIDLRIQNTNREKHRNLKIAIGDLIHKIYQELLVKDLNGNILPKNKKFSIVWGEEYKNKHGNTTVILKGNRKICKKHSELMCYLSQLRGKLKKTERFKVVMFVKNLTEEITKDFRVRKSILLVKLKNIKINTHKKKVLEARKTRKIAKPSVYTTKKPSGLVGDLCKKFQFEKEVKQVKFIVKKAAPITTEPKPTEKKIDPSTGDYCKWLQTFTTSKKDEIIEFTKKHFKDKTQNTIRDSEIEVLAFQTKISIRTKIWSRDVKNSLKENKEQVILALRNNFDDYLTNKEIEIII